MKGLVLLILVISICGCKRDLPISTSCLCSYTDSCTDTNEPARPNANHIPATPTFYYDSSYVMWTYFNPNSPNEFIYYKPYPNTGLPELIKYDISAMSTQILYTGALYSRPVWGRQGWILLNLSNAQIYKLKETGDSLTQVTFGLGDFHPEWDYWGDKFITEHSISSTSISYNAAIYSINGEILDSFGINYNGGCWQNQNNLLLLYTSAPNNGVAIFNTQTHAYSQLLYAGQTDSVGEVFWYPDNVNILYADICGDSKLDYITNQSQCLIHECPNDRRVNFSISPISNKILCVRVHQKYLYTYHSSDTYLISSTICTMNFDGSEEQQINLPQ